MAEESENATSARNGAEVLGRHSEKDQLVSGRLFSRKNLWKRREVILVTLVVVLALGGILYWWRSTFWESTDDAKSMAISTL